MCRAEGASTSTCSLSHKILYEKAEQSAWTRLEVDCKGTLPHLSQLLKKHRQDHGNSPLLTRHLHGFALCPDPLQEREEGGRTKLPWPPV